jgi:hypothetical protein
MAAAIHFDHQSVVMAIEVGNVRADGMLAAEFGLAKLAVLQDVPKALFSKGAAPPKGTASGRWLWHGY